MKHILTALSEPNKFTLDHVRIIKFDYVDNEQLYDHVVKYRESNPGPYVLLKHHTFVNFTKYNYPQEMG